MIGLYIFILMLASSVVLKTVQPLLGRGRHKHTDLVTQEDRYLAAFLTVCIPVAALCVYGLLGQPELQGRQAMFGNLKEQNSQHYALLSERPLETLLHKNPDDLGALLSLGDINYQMGRYAEAAKFYVRAVRIAQKTNDMLLRVYAVTLGEIQVLASEGRVESDAVETFRYVQTLYAKSPIARYYLVLAQAQHGEPEKALVEWQTLVDEGPAGAYWKKMVRQKIAETKEALRANAKK